MTEIEMLEKRVANLERAIIGLWAILDALQPPYVNEAGNKLFKDLFDASESLGGYQSMDFERLEAS